MKGFRRTLCIGLHETARTDLFQNLIKQILSGKDETESVGSRSGMDQEVPAGEVVFGKTGKDICRLVSQTLVSRLGEDPGKRSAENGQIGHTFGSAGGEVNREPGPRMVSREGGVRDIEVSVTDNGRVIPGWIDIVVFSVDPDDVPCMISACSGTRAVITGDPDRLEQVLERPAVSRAHG